jgi:hypothetical protein
MARQEDDLRPAQPTETKRRGRLTPRRVDPLLTQVLDAGQIVDTRAADDSEHGTAHAMLLWQAAAEQRRSAPELSVRSSSFALPVI